MKRFLFFILCLAVASTASAQISVLVETFDTGGGNVTSTAGWGLDNTLQTSVPNSDSCTINTAAPEILTTVAFNTTGNSFVTLNFEHICKVEFFDNCIVEVSNDNGATWTQLTDTEYQGTSPFGAQGNKFSTASYPDWLPASSTAIPTNAWWKSEVFDISALVGNTAQAMVRFSMADGNGNGAAGFYRWNIDDIDIVMAPCELNPPVISDTLSILVGQIFSLGPFTLDFSITDPSGILFGDVNWTLNGVPQPTAYLSNAGGDLYQAFLPAVSDSDTICYTVVAADASGCFNLDTLAEQCFVATAGITFPYCDNFDFNTFWEDSTVSGSVWEQGIPNFGATTGAHSVPNAWDVDLTSLYQANSETYVVSPVFDFSTTPNATLSFWQNRNTESNWDGVRIDYTLNSGLSWQVLDTNGGKAATNWYTDNSIISSNLPAWDGNSGGWIESTIELGNTFNGQFAVQFRFAFTSDGSVQFDGFSFDDLCVTPPQDYDVGVTAIVKPSLQAPAGDTLAVEVTVKNFGANPIDTIPVTYQINNDPPVSIIWTGGTILPGNDTNIIMPTFISPSGQYDVCAWTELPNDGLLFNDTTCGSSVGVPLLGVPYFDDFDTGNVGWVAVAATNGQTLWELGTPGWGTTNSAFSFPNSWDINLTSPYGPDADAALYTPFFDWNNYVNATLSFWQNRNLDFFSTFADDDAVVMEYTIDGGATWSVLGDVNHYYSVEWYNEEDVFTNNNKPGWNQTSGGQANQSVWVKSEIDLNILNTVTAPVQFRFVFTSNAFTTTDGMSIDNFQIELAPAVDAGTFNYNVAGTNAVQLPAGSSSSLDAVFRNFGVSNLDSLNICYSVDNGIPVCTPWTGLVLPGDTSGNVSLPAFNFPSGQFELCIWTETTGDGNANNDTTCVDLVGIPTFALDFLNGFCDEFDTANIGWAPNDGFLLWENGAPAGITINTPVSAPNVWMIDLDSPYQDNMDDNLYSPFFDFSNAVDAEMSFMQWIDCDPNADAGRVDYSVDLGLTWQTLGVFNDPQGVNWYNNDLIFTTGEPGWDSQSGTWFESEYKLNLFNNYPNPVQFRFNFSSSGFGSTRDGWAIDDFCIEVPVPLSAASVQVNSANPLILPGPQAIQAEIENVGTTPITTLDITLRIGGSPVVTDSRVFNPPLQRFDVITHTFSTPWQASSGCHDVEAITSNPNATVDLNPADDTSFVQLCVFDSTRIFPFCTDFESGPQWVSLNAFDFSIPNSWELGTPSEATVSGAFSGANAWMTRLTADYDDTDSS
ncbi:MAG: hypothetical protein HKO56_01470, partial [Bacteroidia bacterium]|nr:hypothetical protein [Bacteroidia bacterium]